MKRQPRPDPTLLAEYADGVLRAEARRRFERRLASRREWLEDLRALYEDRFLFQRWLASGRDTDFRPAGTVRIRRGGLEVVRSGCTAVFEAESLKEAAGRPGGNMAASVRFETSRGPVLLSTAEDGMARLELRWKDGTAEVKRSGRLVGRGSPPLSLSVESRGRYEIIADGRTVLTIRFS